MTILNRFAAAALGVSLAAGGRLTAQEARYMEPAAIDRAVARFTGIEAGAPGGARPVDRRLRLARCHPPLALAWHGKARDTVRVSCSQDGGWQVFVAVPSAQASRAQADAPLIARGDPVAIRIVGRAFSITAAGQALEPGAAGTFIRVRSDSSKAPLRARVEQAGHVTVTLSPEA